MCVVCYGDPGLHTTVTATVEQLLGLLDNIYY